MTEEFQNHMVKFSEESLVRLDSRTRSILAIDGLPSANPVFSAEPSGSTILQAIPDVGEVVLLGQSLNGSGAQICVNIYSGTVLEYRPDFADTIYVNRDVKKFRNILKLFESRSVFHLEEGDEGELDVLLRISEELKLKIAAIDSSALVEGEDFWGTILMEISNGDWSDEGIYLIVAGGGSGD